MKGIFGGRLWTCYLMIIAIMWCQSAVEPSVADAGPSDSISSLRKIDDFPMYAMNYSGDYYFAEFLRHGAKNTQELNRFLFSRRLITRPIQDNQSWACSCFTAANGEGGVLYGRNYDLKVKPLILLLHTRPPDGHASVSIVNLNTLRLAMERRGAQDIAENILAAPYFPADGMNEHGVAVAILTVPTASSEDNPAKVTILRWQASRLILDYARSVDEAMELVRRYNVIVRALGTSVHYFLADAAGNSAVIEYVDGQMQVIRSSQPWQAVTNYIIYNNIGNEGKRRYSRLAQVLTANGASLSETAAMDLLRSVSLETTRWSAVYNLRAREVHLSLGRQYEKVRKFGLKPTN